MAQAINLQITPSKVMPKIYASQFDIGREIQISLYDGATAYIPPVGTDIRFEGKKPDGNGFSYACTYSGNVVTVITTDQMTVLAGEIPCEIRMSLNGDDIGTLNIIFVIEKSPIDGTVPISDTEIPAIIELAREEQYNAEAWATGQRNGVPVGPDDPTYHNNAEYYAHEAHNLALDDLTNVDIDTPTTGQGLIYDGDTQKWVDGNENIADLEGVNISTPADGDLFQYNGSTGEWENKGDLLYGVNLLDNPFFTVNQRGKSSYTGAGYTFDRWKKWAGTISISGIIKTLAVDSGSGYGLITQNLEDYSYLEGKKLTMSVMLSDDTVLSGTATFVNSSTSVTFFNNSSVVMDFDSGSFRFIVFTDTTFKAIKLEFGNVSTLGMDTAPNFEQELAKCQRYFVRIKGANNNIFANGWFTDASYANFIVPLPCPMRAAPTATINGTIYVWSPTKIGAGAYQSSTFYAYNYSNNGVEILAISISGTETVGNNALAQFRDATSYIDLSADL